jgi:hypothetical protein
MERSKCDCEYFSVKSRNNARVNDWLQPSKLFFGRQ